MNRVGVIDLLHPTLPHPTHVNFLSPLQLQPARLTLSCCVHLDYYLLCMPMLNGLSSGRQSIPSYLVLMFQVDQSNPVLRNEEEVKLEKLNKY